MKTALITDIILDKSAGTVTFSNMPDLDLARIVSVVDVTRGVTIYSRNILSLGGTLTGSILTVTFDTDNSNFDNADVLVCEYSTDNFAEEVVSSAARVVTGQSNQIDNVGAKGAMFLINVSAASGTPSMTVKVQMKDAVSANYVDIPGAVTGAITGTGQTLLTVYPGVTESANSKVSSPLPRHYRLVWTISGGTPSLTFTIGAHYIP